MQAAEDRPPYVQFEMRPIEDREASLEEGGIKYKDIIFAIITPMGSKDRVERVATEWLQQNDIHVRDGRMPAEWQRAFRHAFEEFKAGREVPENGLAITNCPMFTPAQVKSCLDANLRTVEDLAAANESALVMIGLGGRALKQRAQAWLDSQGKEGKIAGELEKLRQEIQNLTSRAEKAETDNQALKSALEALKSKEEA